MPHTKCQVCTLKINTIFCHRKQKIPLLLNRSVLPQWRWHRFSIHCLLWCIPYVLWCTQGTSCYTECLVHPFYSPDVRPHKEGRKHKSITHYNDVRMSAVVSQTTSLTTVYSTVYSRRRSKKKSKLCVTDLCEGNSPVTDEFPAQRASNAENVSIWWRHHVIPQG